LKTLTSIFSRQTKEELQAEVEMAWDDSALNITVNPIDVRHLSEFPISLDASLSSYNIPCAFRHHERKL